jgi:hypothetical protein
MSEPAVPRVRGVETCHYCAKVLGDMESGGNECNDCWEIKSRVGQAVNEKPEALRVILADCGISWNTERSAQ